MVHFERDDRTHSASRFIAALPGAIYEALVRPDQLVHWLPPAGATGHIDALEPVPGGRFRMTLTFAAATGKTSPTTDVVNGRFVELAPGQRLVQAFTFESDDPVFAGVMKMTWQLDARPGGTEVTVRAEDVPRGIGRADHEQAMASTLENLATFLSR